jgi:hypothetical protein
LSMEKHGEMTMNPDRPMLDKNAKVVETLTREQVEQLRDRAQPYRETEAVVSVAIPAKRLLTLCDMALLSLEYSERLTKLEGALRELLAAGEGYAKAALTMENARDNFTDSGPEMHSYEQAMLRVSAAEKAARSALPEEPK